MANSKLDNSNISRHLGQTSQYKSVYDSSLLVKEPRSNNRQYLGIFDENLPFVGSDTWNAYECSFLLFNGQPITGVVKINYPCDSKYIVESKSIKLYLNSFNMETELFRGHSKESAIDTFVNVVANDLSNLLETTVNVNFMLGNYVNTKFSSPNYAWDIEDYINLDELNTENESFTVYTETPSLLQGSVTKKAIYQKFYSGLLKSNCRVTSQPDWGDVFIRMKSNTKLDPVSVLKYIVSYRDECHFHEEICECIYKRLYDMCEPSELFVMCLYARRGGIDINPVRASSQELIDRYADSLVDVNICHIKTSKQ